MSAGSGERHQSRGCRLVFKDVGVQIGKKDILSGVSGVAEPGEMLALMGPSGAGKSTLLNCLAGRKDVDSGSISMDLSPINKQLRRKISFVLQNDIFLSELTCWETIWYTALLRLPGSMPMEEKKKRVYEIIDALEMRKCINTRVGDAGHGGLSGGERKRTTIACELLTNPTLMLLDEPTSGLDSSTAYNLCTTIKDFARISGKTVIVSIHQPSSKIFNLFDKLLLLCDGEVAFFGDIQRCAEFFSSIDLKCPTNYNLADHILDQVKEPEVKSRILERAQEQRKEPWYPKELRQVDHHGNGLTYHTEYTPTDRASLIQDNGYVDHLHANGMCNSNHTNSNYPEKFSYGDLETGDLETGDVKFDDCASSSTDSDEVRFKTEYSAKWPTGFWLQYTVLTRRSLKQAIPRILSKWNVLQIVTTAVFSGVLWFKTEPKEAAIFDRQGLVFFTLILLAFYTLIDAMMSFPGERTVLNKERLAGYYRLSAYYLAKLSSDVPLLCILPFTYITITYWLSLINIKFSVYLQMWLCMTLTSLLSHSIGLFYTTLILDIQVSMMCSTTTMLVLTLAGGYYVRNVPVWFRWIKYLAFTQHAYYAILTVDLTNIHIECAPENSRFLACRSGGNSTMSSNATRYIPQQDLLDEYTLAQEGWLVWHHILVCISLMLLTRVATYLVLRYIRKPHIA